MEGIYDVIVVGAGIEGSSTAYQLAKQGKHTLLIEQFPLPHSRGSSHGQSRITRKAYGKREFYTQMMFEAYKMTEELENECGEELFVNCGCLMFSAKGDTFVKEIVEGLQRFNVPYEKFDVTEQRVKYPQLAFDDDYTFVIDKTGGILRADKILMAYQSMFKKCGGILKDGEPMIDLLPGQIVTVKSTKGAYIANSVVLVLGPWAAKFLPRIGVNIPLQPVKITVCYWKEKGGTSYDAKRFPCFTTNSALGKYHIYGLPADEYPGLVKICLHTGPDIDPDSRDAVDDKWVIETLKPIIAEHFPTLEAEPSIVESCIYTNTPDKNCVLDRHPHWRNIVIAAGFSGQGFKLAPVIGKLATQLITDQRPEFDMTPFRIDRFVKNKL